MMRRPAGAPPGFWSNRRLHLILMPTEACNFRCAYCYEDYRHGRAGDDVVEGIRNLLTRRFPGLEQLNVSWFGGEPLLAVDIVREVMEHVGRLAGRHPDVSIGGDMTTNGWRLDGAMLAHLVSLRIDRYQITLDGPREVHDARRRRAGGQGTFDGIWAHLLEARALDARFRILLRLHADRGSAPRLGALIDRCADAFSGDARFTVMPKLVGRWGGVNDHALDTFTPAEERAVLGLIRARARAAGLAVEEPRAELCYAARPDSLVVRADGRVNKCTVALEHPGNQVGRLRRDGTLSLEPEAMKRWTDAATSRDESERHCPQTRVKRLLPAASIPLEFRAG